VTVATTIGVAVTDSPPLDDTEATGLAGKVVAMRAHVMARMIDRCRLVGDPGRTTDDTYNELTLGLTPPPSDPEVLWPTGAELGRCLVNYRLLGGGDAPAGPTMDYVIALPWNMDPIPKPGQWVEITTAALVPGVAGATLTVTTVERGSLAPYVRVRASLTERREVAPGG